jgi:hypothetical protein
VKDRIRCELVKLHTINIEKPTKKFMGKKRESAEKERKKHHPIAICLGLVQLLLRGSRGHPASRGARCLPLGHIVLH